MKNYANMTEFAAALGLSRSTVSYILNGKWRDRNISPETAERVLSYAEEVKFVPNLFGQAMKGKIQTDVAILLPYGIHQHYQQAFFNFLTVIRKKQYSYMVLPLLHDQDNTAVIRQLEMFKIRRVLVIASTGKNKIPWWREVTRQCPQIRWFFYDYNFEYGLGAEYFPANVSAAGFDRHESTKSVLAYIAEAGYQQILWRAFIRTEEIDACAKKLKLELLTPPPLNTADMPEAGRLLGDYLLSMPKPAEPLVVYSSDDIMTAAAINHLLQHNRRVPEDFAFISWDGLDVSHYFQKPITTLVVPHAEMTAAAATFLDDHAEPRFTRISPSIRPGATLIKINGPSLKSH